MRMGGSLLDELRRSVSRPMNKNTNIDWLSVSKTQMKRIKTIEHEKREGGEKGSYGNTSKYPIIIKSCGFYLM